MRKTLNQAVLCLVAVVCLCRVALSAEAEMPPAAGKAHLPEEELDATVMAEIARASASSEASGRDSVAPAPVADSKPLIQIDKNDPIAGSAIELPVSAASAPVIPEPAAPAPAATPAVVAPAAVVPSPTVPAPAAVAQPPSEPVLPPVVENAPSAAPAMPAAEPVVESVVVPAAAPAAPSASPIVSPVTALPSAESATRNETVPASSTPAVTPAMVPVVTSAVSVTHSVSNEVILELEGRMRSLNDSLAAASLRIRELTKGPGHGGRLGELERKALAYEAAHIHIAIKEQEIEALKNGMARAKAENRGLQLELGRMTTVTNEMNMIVARLEKEKKTIQSTLDLIRMGKYEYYEVREGDTCESIATQPRIYGDRAKHVLIRQANSGSVPDLERLIPGQILVIPRFPASGRYEF